MDTENISLTESEWQVMECLWEHSPKTGRELTEELALKMGWSRSTTLTFLRRLEGKRAVSSEGSEKVKAYSPLISRENAALAEATGLLSRVYNGSIGLLVSSLTKKQRLSREEIDEMYKLLSEMEANCDD